MIGTTLDDIKELKAIGESVLKKEIEHCIDIPSVKRIIMLDHVVTLEGEGEPG